MFRKWDFVTPAVKAECVPESRCFHVLCDGGKTTVVTEIGLEEEFKWSNSFGGLVQCAHHLEWYGKFGGGV